MRVWLLLSGEFSLPLWSLAPEDIVIAVDGGMTHAATLGVLPASWIGDFDSASQALQARYAMVPRETFPIDKDKTDFELALEYVQTHYPDAVVCIVGCDGAEDDHVFANLWALPQCARPVVLWRAHSVIVGGKQLRVEFTAPLGSKVSVFALRETQGITSTGLRWEMYNRRALPFHNLTTRNEVTQPPASVRWESGYALLFLPADVSALSLFA